jgi:phosphatidylinositol 4-kinase
MGERFKNATVQAELTRLVRQQPQRVLHVPDAVRYLIGDNVDPSARAALKVSTIIALFVSAEHIRDV